MNKMYILGISLLLVAIFAVTMTPGIQLPVQSQGINYHSQVCVYKNDELIECSSNVLYNTGKNIIREYLGDTGGGGDEVDQIALCNATTSACEQPVAAKTEAYTAITLCGLQQTTGSYGALAQDGNCCLLQTA